MTDRPNAVAAVRGDRCVSSEPKRAKSFRRQCIGPWKHARVPVTAADDIASLVRSSAGVDAWVRPTAKLIHWIKRRLRVMGLRQYAIGDHLGLPKSRVSEIMKGRRRISVRELHKLSELLGPLPHDVATAPLLQRSDVPAE